MPGALLELQPRRVHVPKDPSSNSSKAKILHLSEPLNQRGKERPDRGGPKKAKPKDVAQMALNKKHEDRSIAERKLMAWKIRGARYL